jgi:hypothetical protein
MAMAEDALIAHRRAVLARDGELIYLGDLTPRQRARLSSMMPKQLRALARRQAEKRRK